MISCALELVLVLGLAVVEVVLQVQQPDLALCDLLLQVGDYGVLVGHVGVLFALFGLELGVKTVDLGLVVRHLLGLGG